MIETWPAPEWWAGFLVNDDPQGLQGEELQRAREFRNGLHECGFQVVGCGDPYPGKWEGSLCMLADYDLLPWSGRTP